MQIQTREHALFGINKNSWCKKDKNYETSTEILSLRIVKLDPMTAMIKIHKNIESHKECIFPQPDTIYGLIYDYITI